MKQSVVTVDRIIDKIVYITTSIDDITKLIAELSYRRTTIDHEMNNVRFAIDSLYKDLECYHLTSRSEIENAEEITNKIRDLEAETITYKEDRDKYTETLSIQQQYLEKQLYAKKLLESLLDFDSEEAE